MAKLRTATIAPKADINTTPLIDVLLVLLVMLIITIPAGTHSLDVDLPNCGEDCMAPQSDPVVNRLTLDASDHVRWNGEPVTSAQLTAASAANLALPVEPELQFAPDARASYEAAANAMRTIKASGATWFGFVGNEQYRDFDRAD